VNTPPLKPRHTVRNIVLGVIGAVVLLCALGAVLLGIGSSAKPTAAPTTAAVTRAVQQPTNRAVSPSPASVTIAGDDVVHVGQDVPSGIYRADTAVQPGSNCYWQKSTDAEGTNIIANDNPPGGRPEVTLTAGQWFKTQNCPTWVRQRK
jgi:hypothetical protein